MVAGGTAAVVVLLVVVVNALWQFNNYHGYYYGRSPNGEF